MEGLWPIRVGNPTPDVGLIVGIQEILEVDVAKIRSRRERRREVG